VLQVRRRVHDFDGLTRGQVVVDLGVNDIIFVTIVA
jgi:hypothetical protein